jgi:hypothetical protein
MTVVLTVDVTPWALVAAALGAILGAYVKRPTYAAFAALATVFSVYASSPLWGTPYTLFHFVAWILAVFFATAALSNIYVAWARRLESQLQMILTYLAKEEE